MPTTPEAIGNVREVDITNEMHEAYLDYAMSVIVSRALPDVRDGLKPVHRRILYAMHDMGISSSKPYKKSARIVGEVLGKYHPHSDTAVYDAMVRMAQEFSLRYPLIDGQGNFGSIDGDNAAAMRYTEARLAPITDLVLSDLEKETIEWTENFDNTLREPVVLPATLPNLLINGANGIAVGMATSIPPHNLGEIVDALVYMLDNYARVDEISVEELMRFVNGPDFPTGGILYRFRQGRKDDDENVDAIAQGYATGRARLILQAKAHFEEMSRNRNRIVITELPYQTNKTNLLERIASLVRDNRVEGITDLRDESDRTGMRIVIECTRTVEPKAILADLFKYTPMQQTFGMSMLALVEGEPRTLSLRRMLQLFIEHRREVIRRRSEFDLARARARAHIVEGLLKALDIMDEVIETIRRSQRVETARTNLMRAFGFSEVQAQAILDMPLKRLAALERKRLQDEYKELQQQIDYLTDLLAHPEKILGVVREEILALRSKYADSRRTQIVERTKGTLTSTDLLPDQKTWVSVGTNGDLQRQAYAGVSATSLRQAGQNAGVLLQVANTRDYLYLFAADGRCRRLGVHEIPHERGKNLADVTDFSRRDRITAALALPRWGPDDTDDYLFLVTEKGFVKRIALSEFIRASASDPEVMRVDESDRLGWVFITPGEEDVILVSAQGQSIRFHEADVRPMGLAAGGVSGIKLKKNDRIVAASLVAPQGLLITATANGYVKCTATDEYSRQGRNGSGIIAHKLDKRTGTLVHAAIANPGEHELVLFVTAKGVAKLTSLTDLTTSGRSTLGQRSVDVAQGDGIAAVQLTLDHTEAGDEPENSGPPANGALQPDATGAGPPVQSRAKSPRRATSAGKNGAEGAIAQASAGRSPSTTSGAERVSRRAPRRPATDTAPSRTSSKRQAGRSPGGAGKQDTNASATPQVPVRRASKNTTASSSPTGANATTESGRAGTAKPAAQAKPTTSRSRSSSGTKPAAAKTKPTDPRTLAQGTLDEAAAKPAPQAKPAAAKTKPTDGRTLAQGKPDEVVAKPMPGAASATVKPVRRAKKSAKKVQNVSSVTPSQRKKKGK